MRPSACDKGEDDQTFGEKGIFYCSLFKCNSQTNIYANMPCESSCQEFTQWIYVQNSIIYIMIFIKIININKITHNHKCSSVGN